MKAVERVFRLVRRDQLERIKGQTIDSLLSQLQHFLQFPSFTTDEYTQATPDIVKAVAHLSKKQSARAPGRNEKANAAARGVVIARETAT